MSNLYIAHHFGLGDHFVCSGLVRHLSKAYAKTFVFCTKKYAETVSALYSDTKGKIEPYILPYEINLPLMNQSQVLEDIQNISRNANGKLKIIGFRPIEMHHGASFDDSFYIQCAVPFDYKWDNFRVPDRYICKEPNPSYKYAFVHQDISRNYLIDVSKISLPIIEPNHISTGYEHLEDNSGLFGDIIKNKTSGGVERTLKEVVFKSNTLDWIKTIQEASEIHCIDSSFINLIDLLDESKIPMCHQGRIYYHYYSRKAVPGAQPHLRKPWIRLNNPPENVIGSQQNIPKFDIKTPISIANIHICDGNIGDNVCSPLHYFDFPRESYHVDIRKIGYEQFRIKDQILVVGGGGLIHQVHSQMDEIGKSKNKKIFWGTGHNSHDLVKEKEIWPDWIGGYDMKGLRDFKNPFEYLPDVSCMSEFFDDDIIPKNKFSIYQHAENPIFENHNFMNFPKMNNYHPSFRNVINFLKNSEVILTNTYHGAYWCLLLNRKVILYRPFSTRFFRFKYEIPKINNFLEITKDLLLLCPDTKGYLEECRYLNIEYHKRFLSII